MRKKIKEGYGLYEGYRVDGNEKPTLKLHMIFETFSDAEKTAQERGKSIDGGAYVYEIEQLYILTN